MLTVRSPERLRLLSHCFLHASTLEKKMNALPNRIMRSWYKGMRVPSAASSLTSPQSAYPLTTRTCFSLYLYNQLSQPPAMLASLNRLILVLALFLFCSVIASPLPSPSNATSSDATELVERGYNSGGTASYYYTGLGACEWVRFVL